MRKYRPDEVSKILSISVATVYRLIKRLVDSQCEGVEKDEAGRVCLTERGLEKIREAAGAPRCESNENQPEAVSALRDTIENQTRIIENHLENIRKKDELITALIATQAEERKRADTIIMTLSKQIEGAAKQIEDLRNHVVAPEPSAPDPVVETTVEDDGKPSILNHRMWDKMQKDFDAFMKTQAA